MALGRIHPTAYPLTSRGVSEACGQPIFEADFEPNAWGYRPKRSAQDAVREVHRRLREGYTDVVDADLSKYFDTIPHAELMQCVARRIVDGKVLHLIRMWLAVPVAERGDRGDYRMTGGAGEGTPQGGVISPLLANLYMNRFLKYWRLRGKGEKFRAHVVAYADDFVILSRGHAEKAREWAQATMERIGLTLNPEKTSIRDARSEEFDFLGYSFGPRYWWETGKVYTARPSKKSMKRLRQNVRELLRPSNVGPWEEVCRELNQKLEGWGNYFSYGSLSKAYKAANLYVYDRVRHFLRRRNSKVQSRGTSRYPYEQVFGSLGVHQLRRTRG